MKKRITLVALAVALVVAALPGVAAADDGDDDDDGDMIYLSLGTSLAAGTIADGNGDNRQFSNKSYTNRLHRILQKRVDDDIRHVKLGCPGETTDQFLGGVNGDGNPTACVSMYATGSQLGDALATLATGDVALVTLDIGANDILQLQNRCVDDPSPYGDLATCIGAGIPDIIQNVAVMLTLLRNSGYTGPIVGSLYYNPQIAAAAGFFAGYPGPGPADPGLAVLSDALAVGFNGALAAVYDAFGSPYADWYAAFHSGDFGDNGGRFQEEGNGVWDSVDAVCVLTTMCPDFPAKANIHPSKKGYRVMAKAMWFVIKPLDIGDDDDDD